MLQASGIVLSEDQIKETFFIIAGDVKMTLDGKVIEEITTHQIPDDSYFEDPGIRGYVAIEDG